MHINTFGYSFDYEFHHFEKAFYLLASPSKHYYLMIVLFVTNCNIKMLGMYSNVQKLYM